MNDSTPPNWLLAVRGTLAADADQVAFDAWYDDTHLPEILSCPGFRWGRRYYDDADRRGFMTVYGLDNPNALTTAEFAARRGFREFAPDVEFRTTLFRAHPGTEEQS